MTIDPSVEALALVHQEMKRQVAKWGEQSHPSYKHDDVIAVLEHHAQLDIAGSITEHAKEICDCRLGSSECSWQDILNEEVLEARDEAMYGDLTKLQEELIQIAAVALSWHNSITRNGK
jgi:hypothetical protein